MGSSLKSARTVYAGTHYSSRMRILTAAMVGVTADPRGTAHAAMQGTTYRVAGKTGTAQVFTVAQD